MVFWMPWRCEPLENFSDFTATAPPAFPVPLEDPAVAPFEAGDAADTLPADSPDPPAAEILCPTAAMAPSFSLERVLVEPME